MPKSETTPSAKKTAAKKPAAAKPGKQTPIKAKPEPKPAAKAAAGLTETERTMLEALKATTADKPMDKAQISAKTGLTRIPARIMASVGRSLS